MNNNINEENEINPFSKPVRINKFLSEAKYCSRREADRLIEDRRVTIDGESAVPGQKVKPGQIVAVDGKAINISGEYVYLVYNKPAGIICTTDLSVKGNIIEAIEFPERIFPVGRLDKDSTGLIILTNDGEIVNKILRGGNHHEKEYIVEVDKIIDDEFIENMSSGVRVLGIITKKCKVKKLEPTKFKIILTQGLNRQIRRMCEYLGYDVTSLKRVRIMNITLGTLKPGKYRHITKKEMAEIENRIKDSVKTPVNYEEFDE
jgi:23S rRNA pseudouridine2604 synthase